MLERADSFLVIGDEILEAPLEAARAAAAAFLRAKNPAPQLGGFLPGQRQRKRRVGGIEQMMALVEYEPRRQIGIVEAAQRRLHHHQRVIGDNDAGTPRATYALFDEAFVIMRTGRMDTLAAPVGETDAARAPDQVGQPARKI